MRRVHDLFQHYTYISIDAGRKLASLLKGKNHFVYFYDNELQCYVLIATFSYLSTKRCSSSQRNRHNANKASKVISERKLRQCSVRKICRAYLKFRRPAWTTSAVCALALYQ